MSLNGFYQLRFPDPSCGTIAPTGTSVLNFGSKYKNFWKWFQSHEDELFNFDRNQEIIFGKLAVALQRVHPDLVFEFSSVENGRRELVISAAGIKKAFPEVSALVGEAPTLARWKVLAFRQRQKVPSIECGGLKMDYDAVYFDYVRNDDRFDVTVFLPGLANATPQIVTGLKTIGYLFLDATVGEYDVETKIAGIEFVDVGEYPRRPRIPLRELADIVDKLPSIVH